MNITFLINLNNLKLQEGEQIETISIKSYLELNKDVSPVTNLILSKFIKKNGY